QDDGSMVSTLHSINFKLELTMSMDCATYRAGSKVAEHVCPRTTGPNASRSLRLLQSAGTFSRRWTILPLPTFFDQHATTYKCASNLVAGPVWLVGKQLLHFERSEQAG